MPEPAPVTTHVIPFMSLPRMIKSLVLECTPPIMRRRRSQSTFRTSGGCPSIRPADRQQKRQASAAPLPPAASERLPAACKYLRLRASNTQRRSAGQRNDTTSRGLWASSLLKRSASAMGETNRDGELEKVVLHEAPESAVRF